MARTEVDQEEPLDVEQALALEGSGWEGDLDIARDSRGPLDMTTEERSRTLVLFPEWGGEERVPRSITLSEALRQRLRAWNHIWQTVLDPVTDIRWPQPDLGHRWIAEGNALVTALQDEIGPSIRVVGDFQMYDPAVRTRTP